MSAGLIRILAAVLAVVVIAIIVVRRKRMASRSRKVA